MTWKHWKNAFGITMMILMLVGCDSGSGGSSEETKVETSMDLSLAALYTGKSSKTVSSKQVTAATTILLGELQAENHTTGTVETFTWSAYLDESDFNMTSNKTIALVPGDYTFTMVLSNDNFYYAGEAFYEIVDGGQHSIPLTIKPIIGDTNIDVSVVGELAGYKFKYATNELTDIVAPQLGVIVDGGAEQMFTINPATGLTDTYLNLTNGSHTIHLNLYDANVQIGRSVPEQETIDIVAGEPFSIDLIALHGEAEFVFDVTDGNATVIANVPQEVIDEIGLDKLQVVLLLSDNNTTTHEAVMTLTTENNATTASVTLEGLQYGTYAMQLKFNSTDDTDVPVASCLIDSVILDKTGSTVDCTLTLQKRAIIGGNLLATVGVNVFNTSYEPVAGAKVYANDTLIGLTGSGSFGTKGYLKIYHVEGNVTLKAEDINMTGSKDVTLDPLSVSNHDIILDTQLFDGNITGGYGKPWKYAPDAPGEALNWVDTGKDLLDGLTAPSVVRVGDNVFLMGGRTGDGTFSDKVYQASVLDPRYWIDTGATIPSAMGYSQSVIINDSLYLFGGHTGGTKDYIFTASIATPTQWSDTNKTLPSRLMRSQAVVLEDDVYLFGGHDGSNYVDTIFKASVNDPSSWSNTGVSLPTQLGRSQAAVIGNYIYLFGGYNGSSCVDGIFRASVDSPTEWSDTGATLPDALCDSQVAVVGDYVYLFGGYNSSGYLKTIFRAPVNNPTSWSDTGAVLPTAVGNSQVAVAGDYIYLFSRQSYQPIIYRAYIGN